MGEIPVTTGERQFPSDRAAIEWFVDTLIPVFAQETAARVEPSSGNQLGKEHEFKPDLKQLGAKISKLVELRYELQRRRGTTIRLPTTIAVEKQPKTQQHEEQPNARVAIVVTPTYMASFPEWTKIFALKDIPHQAIECFSRAGSSEKGINRLENVVVIDGQEVFSISSLDPRIQKKEGVFSESEIAMHLLTFPEVASRLEQSNLVIALASKVGLESFKPNSDISSVTGGDDNLICYSPSKRHFFAINT